MIVDHDGTLIGGGVVEVMGCDPEHPVYKEGMLIFRPCYIISLARRPWC